MSSRPRSQFLSRLLPAVLCALVLPFAARADDAASARRILAGDRLNITVREQPDLSRVYPVAGDGTIDFSFAGRIAIAELTPGEAARKLEKALEKDFFKEATVTVSIANFVEGDVMITGEVATPGVLPFRGDAILTLMEAIVRSGGMTPDAAGERVRILRWAPGGGMERETIEVNVKEMSDSLDYSRDQYLRPRDIVVVPRRGENDTSREFLALGEVRSPGFHPYAPGTDVIKAVTLVGGLGEFADWEKGRILRPRKDGTYTVIPVDLARLFSAADMSANAVLEPRDIFFVPSTRNVVGQQVYLLGKVKHMGAFTFSSGPNATLARVLLEAGGFAEFANPSKVQVQRMGPDGDKKILTVDVKSILNDGTFENDLPLQDGDVIIVPETLWGPGGI